MSEPILWVIAGCNGSGKSSFSKELINVDTLPFDYDKHFLNFYNALQESDIQERMAHNYAFEELENQIASSIKLKQDFVFETNFNSTPLHWPELFKKNGYYLKLTYLALDSINEAIRRVKIRVQNGGHFVSENEIHRRYYDGATNLDTYFSYFDELEIYDCSTYKKPPSFCFSLVNGKLDYLDHFPEYIKKLLPQIAIVVQEALNENEL